MKNQMKELQKLKGIGGIISRRLVEASYDTIAKVAAAEEKGLEKISGMNPQKLRSKINFISPSNSGSRAFSDALRDPGSSR